MRPWWDSGTDLQRKDASSQCPEEGKANLAGSWDPSRLCALGNLPLPEQGGSRLEAAESHWKTTIEEEAKETFLKQNTLRDLWGLILAAGLTCRDINIQGRTEWE